MYIAICRMTLVEESGEHDPGDVYHLPGSPRCQVTPPQNNIHVAGTPGRRTTYKKGAGFQQYLLRERPTLSAKYPFLTTNQIKRKAAELWTKLNDHDKDMYKPAIFM